MIRDRVRAMSVAALRDHKLSVKNVSKLVREVLQGAVECVDESIPASSRNVLREVFDGLREGVHAVAVGASAFAEETRQRGQTAGRSARTAVKRVKTANADFVSAVRRFAATMSKEVQQELDVLASRAEKVGPKVMKSAGNAFKAADGRLLELAQESTRAGVRISRRAAAGIAMSAGGFLEGLAEVVAPKVVSSIGKSTRTRGRRVAKKPVSKKSRTTTAKRTP